MLLKKGLLRTWRDLERWVMMVRTSGTGWFAALLCLKLRFGHPRIMLSIHIFASSLLLHLFFFSFHRHWHCTMTPLYATSLTMTARVSLFFSILTTTLLHCWHSNLPSFLFFFFFGIDWDGNGFLEPELDGHLGRLKSGRKGLRKKWGNPRYLF
jgi:hypothetical protein